MKMLHSNERGLSLVEVTIMLLVLMLLTGVLAPSIADFVNDARWVKVKEDCEAIGLSVARLTRDVGPCLKLTGAGACTVGNRVELLQSNGPAVTVADLGPTAIPASNTNLSTGLLNWDSTTNVDSMEHQFVTNDPGYPVQTTSSVGPLFGLGWRGAYLSPPIGPDPWGRQYLVNTAFLGAAVGSGSGGGQQSVFANVLSSGDGNNGNHHGGGNNGNGGGNG
ncbi:MAG: hypothetical protein WCP29_06335, partial [Acidobacteriota bacterium]